MGFAGSGRPATEASRLGEALVATFRGLQDCMKGKSSYIVSSPHSVSFRFFDCSQPLYTPAVWYNVNPLLDHRIHFASLHTSQRLLEYLQSSAVVLELWGLQGGDKS